MGIFDLITRRNTHIAAEKNLERFTTVFEKMLLLAQSIDIGTDTDWKPLNEYYKSKVFGTQPLSPSGLAAVEKAAEAHKTNDATGLNNKDVCIYLRDSCGIDTEEVENMSFTLQVVNDFGAVFKDIYSPPQTKNALEGMYEICGETFDLREAKERTYDALEEHGFTHSTVGLNEADMGHVDSAIETLLSAQITLPLLNEYTAKLKHEDSAAIVYAAITVVAAMTTTALHAAKVHIENNKAELSTRFRYYQALVFGLGVVRLNGHVAVNLTHDIVARERAETQETAH